MIKIKFMGIVLTFLKKHSFDLDNPEIVDTGREEKGSDGIRRPIRYKKYKCTKCPKILTLEKWQMDTLPISMAYGCRKPLKQK